MKLTVNGEDREVAGDMNIAGLLKEAGLERNRVAVELNGQLIKRAFFDDTELADGDSMEIVTLVGGG